MGYNEILKKVVLLFIVFIFHQNLSIANIIYDKDDILITELELEDFKELYLQNKKKELSEFKAIKELVLLKKTINQLEKKQPDALKTLDKLIINEFGEKKFKDPTKRDFLRYFKLRNEFIIQYFNNELKIDDVETALNSFSELSIPISNNGCKTIKNFVNLKNNNEFIENLYKNFKNKQRDIKIEFENEKFNVCINEKIFSLIEQKLINYIQIKTENRFKAFIYEK